MTIEASAPRRKLSAILMIDVAGFSRMMGQDEERTTVLIREFHDRTQGLVEAHAGRVVDTAGDSVFGEFDSVVNAVRCAQAIQEAQTAVNTLREPAERMETRIGVHLGDVIVQDYRVYGDGVNIAARLQTVAAPGGADVFTAPAVSGSRLFVATASGLACYVLSNGRLHVSWRRREGGTSPVVAGGLLYVYNGSLNVYAAATGKLLVTFSAGSGHWNSPIVTDGRVAVPEGNANDHGKASPWHLGFLAARSPGRAPGLYRLPGD